MAKTESRNRLAGADRIYIVDVESKPSVGRWSSPGGYYCCPADLLAADFAELGMERTPELGCWNAAGKIPTHDASAAPDLGRLIDRAWADRTGVDATRVTIDDGAVAVSNSDGNPIYRAGDGEAFAVSRDYLSVFTADGIPSAQCGYAAKWTDRTARIVLEATGDHLKPLIVWGVIDKPKPNTGGIYGDDGNGNRKYVAQQWKKGERVFLGLIMPIRLG